MAEPTIPTQEEYDNAKRDEMRLNLEFPIFRHDIMREALAATMAMKSLTSFHSIGSGRQTIFSLHNRLQKSHTGRPAGYIKPYGTRTKGYAEHGNGKRGEAL